MADRILFEPTILWEIAEILSRCEHTDFSQYKNNTLSLRIHCRYRINGGKSLDEFISIIGDRV